MIWKWIKYFEMCLLGSIVLIGCNSSINNQNGFSDMDQSIDKNVLKNVTSHSTDGGLSEFELKELEPYDYSSWIKKTENGLLQSKTIENIRYQMIYVTPGYLALRAYGTETITQKDIDLFRDSSLCTIHFVFRISKTEGELDLSNLGVNNQAERNARIKYLAFDIKKDFYLKSDTGEIIPCGLVTYERDYNLAPYATFTIEFPLCNKSKLSNYRVVYSDHLFNHGNLKFYWNHNIIKNIPKLVANE